MRTLARAGAQGIFPRAPAALYSGVRREEKMKRTAKDETAFRPRPVERIELSEKHFPVKGVAVAAAVLLALGALFFMLRDLLTASSGWQTIQADSGAEINCGGDFVLQYCLGQGDTPATAEKKQLVSFYTAAVEKAFKLFHASALYDGVRNVAYLNAHPNEQMEIDPALYAAFAQVEAAESRYLYLGPVYEELDTLFNCGDDSEIVNYDALSNPDMAWYYAQIAAFARDPQAVSLELTAGNTACLRVSQEYLAFAQEYGFTAFIDFYWMKNAFIADYIAGVLQAQGLTHGNLCSYDGFIRNLDEHGESYSYPLYDQKDGKLRLAANLVYPAPASLITLRSEPLNREKEPLFYTLATGETRTAHASLQDGKSRDALFGLTAVSYDQGCAAMLLKITPAYIADSLDTALLSRLAGEGVYTAYCQDGQIYCTVSGARLTQVYSGEGGAYSTAGE